MCPNDPTRDEVLAEMTTEKLEEMARPTPRGASGSGLRDFLEIPYDQLEEMNLQAKEERLARKPADVVREQRMKYLSDERRIKALRRQRLRRKRTFVAVQGEARGNTP